MKRIIFYVFLAVLFFGFAQPVSAHVFKTDGSITVLMHANPDDDPIAGQPASLLFGITDTANKFDPANCDCKVSISDKSKQLLDESLLRIAGAAPSLYALTIPFTFPERAVYSIVVTGAPKTAGAFQNFQVEYDLRVDRTAGNTEAGSFTNHWLLYLFLGVLFIGFFAYYLIRLKNRKKGNHGKSTLTSIFLLVILAGLTLHHAALAAVFCPDHFTDSQAHSCCFPLQTQVAKAALESRESYLFWEPVKLVENNYFFRRIINNKSPPSAIV
ncbi:MAG: hypothetical protein WDN47_04890 [Candidatus Doudnabacteria bacterium]